MTIVRPVEKLAIKVGVTMTAKYTKYTAYNIEGKESIATLDEFKLEGVTGFKYRRLWIVNKSMQHMF